MSHPFVPEQAVGRYSPWYHSLVIATYTVRYLNRFGIARLLLTSCSDTLIESHLPIETDDPCSNHRPPIPNQTLEVGPFANPSETYNYYNSNLAFCQPSNIQYEEAGNSAHESTSQLQPFHNQVAHLQSLLIPKFALCRH